MSESEVQSDSLDAKLVRDKAAIIAHIGRERLLVVKVRGYDAWMLPYGKYDASENAFETARRILSDMICCDMINHAQDLREEVMIPFSRADLDTWEPTVTANFHTDRNLHLYVADLACKSHEMSKGRRVESYNLIKYGELGGFLVGEELAIVSDIMIDIRAGRI